MVGSGHAGGGGGDRNNSHSTTNTNHLTTNTHGNDSGNGIGSLEAHVHEVFARDRLSSEDYIYTSSSELFNTLEDYCDDQQLHIPRPPILILGESGAGKSALLANWLQKRQRNMSRSRAADDFVFWHVVGCTRHSMNVRKMMKRLLIDLKQRFELTRNVSLDPSHYSWDLPRFLELASKKGKITIVIDGLHRFESIEGETNLSWLPLEYPPNVRVIISATYPSRADQSSRPSHVLAELERRKLQVLEIKPLDPTACRLLMETYVKKTVETETSMLVSSVAHSPSSIFLTSADTDETQLSIPLTGLLFFEDQFNDINHHRLSSNPLFLRLLLRATYWAVHRGYCLWTILDHLDRVDNLEKLYHMILTLFENGYHPTPEHIENAKQLCLSSGSLDGLKQQYHWHSAFQDSHNHPSLPDAGNRHPGRLSPVVPTDILGMDFHYSNAPGGGFSTDSSVRPSQVASNTRSTRHGSISVNPNSLTMTGEAQLKLASQHAEAKLETIRRDTLREMDSIVRRAKELMVKDKIKYAEAILRIQQDLLEINENYSHETPPPEQLHLENNETKEPITTPLNNSIQSITESITHNGILQALESIEKLSPDSRQPPLSKEKSTKFELLKQTTSSFEKKDQTRRLSHSSAPHSTSDQDTPTDSGRRLVSVESLDDRYSQSSDSPKGSLSLSDPIVDLKYLPNYLLGGHEVTGFSTLLGNALSLLYVARHGLKESELWSILSQLPHPGNLSSSSSLSSSQKIPSFVITGELKALIGVCFHYREEFARVWKANDVLHTGRLTKGKLLVGMQRVNIEFTHSDLENLLTALDCQPTQNGSSISSLKHFKTISYPILLERLIRAQRVIKLKKKSSQKESKIKSDEDSLFTSVPIGDEIDSSQLTIDSPSTNKRSSFTTDCEGSLGPVLEEALLTSLCALGVLHSSHDQVLILPCDQELFRSVILERYITAKGGTIEEWHMKLIRFFEKKTNSHRRCEELPWHLQICRKWYTLKADVSHLDTFHTMLHGELRSELLGYWYTLTHTPLYVTDKAEEDGISGDTLSTLTENQRILSQIDTAIALHLTPKDIRKQLLKDCVANFDIVDELGQSVENWINQTTPSSSKISEVILQIAKFIAEYCSHYEISPPPFLRIGMDRHCFTQFNIPLDIHTEVTHGLHTSHESTNGENGGIEAEKGNHLTIGTNMMTLMKREVNLYHYFRWMWIQFPWLAMPSVSKQHSSEEYPTGRIDSNLSSNSSHENQEMIKLNNSTMNLMSPMKSTRKGSQFQFDETKQQQQQPSQQQSSLEPTPSLTSPIKKEVNVNPSFSNEELKRREVATRSWQAKKLDPSLGPVNSVSSHRTSALVKSSLTPVSQLNAIENFAKHNFEAFDISVEETPVVSGNHQSINKYRCPLDVHLTSLQDIPFSQPSVRVMKKKTLFPSLVDMREKTNQSVATTPIKSTAATGASSSSFSSSSSSTANTARDKSGTTGEYSLEEDLAYLRNQEKLAALNKKGGSCIPCSTIEDAVNELEIQKTGRYRAAYDKVRELRKSKQIQLEEMKASYVSRKEIDDSVLATISSAESTMSLLEDRYLSLQSALTSVKQLNVGFSTLIAFLQVNPPASETHLESLEQELKLAQQQCEDLRRYRHNIYQEIDRIEKDQNSTLREKISSYVAQKQNISKQIKEQQETLQQLQEKLHISHDDDDDEDREEEGHLSSPSSSKDPTRRTPQTVSFAAVNSNSLPSAPPQGSSLSSGTMPISILIRDLATKKRSEPVNSVEVILTNEESASTDVMELKGLIDHLYEVSGRNNPEDFVEAFRHSQRLYESMSQHQSLAESRVSQLRSEESELQNQLGETMFVSSQDGNEATSTTSERELRYLNQRLFKAEMRLNHNMRLADKGVLTINDVRSGVLHISSLLSCNDTLLQNLPNSNPPTLKSDGGIAKILAWCEERILAINEALVLDASKPVVAEEGKSLYARQADLASVIHAMIRRSSDTTIKPKKKLKAMRRESMSKSILQITAEAEILPSSETGVRISSQVEAEKIYTEKCEDFLKQNNARADLQERAEQKLSVEDPTESIRKVVAAGITSQESSNALRRANKMSKRKQGRRAGYGWTVEELLRDSTFASEGQYALAKKVSLRNQLTSQTPSRYELKQLSLARNRSHYNDHLHSSHSSHSLANNSSSSQTEEVFSNTVS